MEIQHMTTLKRPAHCTRCWRKKK